MAIKVLLIVLILIIISRIIDRYIRKELSTHELVIWIIFWLGSAGFVLWPDASSWLASALGVGRGVDLMVYLALVLVFYLLFRIFVRFEKMERNITKVIRHVALDEANKKEQKKSE